GQAVEDHQFVQGQTADQPPSTTMAWPVTKLEASLARNRSAPSSSFSTPIRPMGLSSLCCCSQAGLLTFTSVISVGNQLGARALTRTPFRAQATARLRVREIIADLLAL